MFFASTLQSKWLIAHRMSQCLMLALLVAMLVMPILHHQPEAVAAAPLIAKLAIGATAVVVAAGGAVIAWLVGKDNPCPNGCEHMVAEPGDHMSPCTNCGKRIYDCVVPTTCQTLCNENNEGCGMLYYTCAKPGVPPSEQQSEQHRWEVRDCNVTCYQVCKPEDNHSAKIGPCGHNYCDLEPCSKFEPRSDHTQADTPCGHTVYKCDPNLDDHGNERCESCTDLYPACEDHDCSSGWNDDSGGCDSSSGCCSSLG